MSEKQENNQILLVSHEMTYTGAPQSLLGMAQILLGNGFNITVWTLNDGPFEQEFNTLGISVKKINFPQDASESFAKQLMSFDLIIANTIFCSGFAAYAKHFSRTILYIREAGNIPQLIKDCGLCESDITEAPYLLCVSEYAASVLRERYGIDNITIIHNFTEDLLETVKKESPIEISSKEENIIHFMVSGTMEPRKGQAVAAAAYRSLPVDCQKKSCLHFVGGQPEWSAFYWQNLMSSENVVQTATVTESSGIFYHGNIQNRQELLRLYEQMDVILIPSEDEACSLVALEAAMLGKMILLSENTGAKYLVDSACVVKTGEIPSWTHMMQKCIEDMEWCSLNGKKNRDAYLNDAVIEIYEDNFLAYIKNIFQNNIKENQEPLKEEMKKMVQNFDKTKKNTLEKVKIHELINFDKACETPIKVSIIIPVCNVEEYLRECLDSAIHQTLQEIEIICVNDGSTDGSLEILKEYATLDDRVKIIDKENAGYGHAMNIGMDMAKGEYIGIIESDDFVSENMYEDLYQIAIANSVDWIKADFNRFTNSNGELKCIYNNVAKKTKFYNRVLNPAEEPFSFRFIMNTWSGIYNKNFIDKNLIRHQETPGASFQDNGFWFQTMIYASRIYIVDKPYYMNRRDNENSSVYSKNKVYCINQEYAFIYDLLKRDEEKYNTFIGEYHLKKYHNYLNHYNIRVPDEERLSYLQAISGEFQQAIDNNELDSSLMYSNELDEFDWIASDPLDYYSQHNKNSIKVSVIVPVYNAQDYLPECLDSILNQSLEEIEIICVDDASSDDSPVILKEYEKKDCRIHVYLLNENKGGGYARNIGLKLAKGEYLSFLDADDFFEPDLLKHSYERSKKLNADICIYQVKRYNNKTKQITHDELSFVEKNIPKKDIFTALDMKSTIFSTFQTWAWNKLFRRHFIEKENILFQEIPRTNDMFFTNVALLKAKRMTVLKEELVFYRIGMETNCQATNINSPTAFFQALMALKNEMENCGYYYKYNVAFKNLFVRSSIYNLNSVKDGQAYAEIYNLLHTQGLPMIKISEWDSGMIHMENMNNYRECLKILEDSFEQYLLDKVNYYREQQIKTNKLIRKLEKTQKDDREALLEDILKRQDYIENELGQLKQSSDLAEDYKMQLILTRASMTYKIGSFITFIPRKIRASRENKRAEQ